MITEAIKSLRPNASFSVNGESIDGIRWFSAIEDRPTDAEILAEANRLTELQELQQYRFKRMHEYPPVAEYLDAVVKGDQEAIQAYIDKCNAVKLKYPKPEGL
jgi:hypothetical protein